MNTVGRGFSYSIALHCTVIFAIVYAQTQVSIIRSKAVDLTLLVLETEEKAPEPESDSFKLLDKITQPRKHQTKSSPTTEKPREQIKVESPEPEPDTFSAALISERSSPQERPLVRATAYRMDTGPDLPVTQPISPVQVASRGQERRDQQGAGRVSTDLTPVTPSESVVRPVRSSITGSARGDRSALLVSAGQTVAIDNSEGVAQLETASAGAGRRGGSRKSGTVSQYQGGGGGALDLPSAPVAVVAAAEPEEKSGVGRRVNIIGIVPGGSTRIENLKEMIYRKASLMAAGAYCSRVNAIDCRLEVAPDKAIRISFSSDVIPFETVSRLERNIPEGLKPCAE